MFFLRWLVGLFARILRFFVKKEEKKRAITFDEWIDLLREMSLKGFECEAYIIVKAEFPAGARKFSEADGNRLLAKEMSKYANVRLSGILTRFQDDVRESLDQNDETRLERAFRVLKSDLGELLFFEKMEGFPESIAAELSHNIEEAVSVWQAEYGAMLRMNFETIPAGTLGEELLWMFGINPPADMLRPMEERLDNYA